MPTPHIDRDKTPRGAWINTTLPLELKRRFRILCAKEDKSMSTKIMEMIEGAVEEAGE